MLATAVTLAIYFALYLAEPQSHNPGSDGHYTWLFARSLVFDGDVDMRNDYAICGDPFQLAARTGRPANLFYAGPAVVWAPLLWIGRHLPFLTRGLRGPAAEGCRGPLTAFALAAAPFVGALTLWCCYRIARRWGSDGVSALAAAFFAWAGPLAAVSTVLPSYTHVFSAAAVSLATLLALRAAERPEAWTRWAVTGLALGVGFLTRPSTLVFAIVPMTLALASPVDLRRRIGALGALAAGIAPGLLAQLAVWRSSFGASFVVPQGRHYLHFDHAHPWLSLFTQRGGLFFTAPAAWISVVGVLLALRKSELRPLAGALLLASIVEIEIDAAALDWSGSASFAARRLVPLTPALVLFAVPALEVLRARFRARPARALRALAIGALVVIGSTTLGWTRAASEGKVPLDRALTQAELYGQGAVSTFGLFDATVGAVSVLPSTLVLRARYGVGAASLPAALDDGWYARDFLTLRVLSDSLRFKEPAGRATLLTAFAPAPDGIQISGPRARLLATAQWPFATRFEIRGSADPPRSVRIGRRGFWGGTTEYGVVELGAGSGPHALPIPEGGFDSGLNEIVLDVEGEVEGGPITLQSIRFVDETRWPPAY